MNRMFRRLLSLSLTLALLLTAVGFLSPSDTAMEATAALADPPTFAPQTEQNNIIGKSVTGYQAWFGRGWYHNWGNSAPGRNLFFEMWPSVGDYPSEALWNSAFGKLNNGEPAKLFDSTNADVIDTHFRWMQEYGIDGAAIQRFYGYGDAHRDGFKYLDYIKEKAEKYDRLFYMMYDMTGTKHRSTEEVLNWVQNDFVNNVEGKGWCSSENYAHADGKPVVCLWGLSGVETDNYLKVDAALALINWFHARGYYVIVGTPDNQFSTVTDSYAEVYASADMLSPWYIGRYDMNGVGGVLRNNVRRDKAYCEAHDIDFLPTIFPGFSWVNLKHTEEYNQIARQGGQFLWRQAVVLAIEGCETVYFAMFDEYDEATALMKGATDSSMIPQGDTFFLTLAADGYWVSDDFYLRLAGAIGEMMDEAAAGEVNPNTIITTLPIPFSEGPVYYRNGFTYYTATVAEKEVNVRLDPCVATKPRSLTFRGSSLIELTANEGVKTESDGWLYRFAGDSTAAEGQTGTVYRTISDTNFVLADDTVLTYRLRAGDQNGEAVYLNLLFEDGTLLSRRMISAHETGAKTGEWVDVTIPISNDLSGMVVTAIVASCEITGTGSFSADVDDILIEIGEKGVGSFAAVPAPTEALLGDVNSDGAVNTTDARLVLQYAVNKIGEEDLDLSVADVNESATVDTTDARLILQKAVGKIEDFA